MHDHRQAGPFEPRRGRNETRARWNGVEQTYAHSTDTHVDLEHNPHGNGELPVLDILEIRTNDATPLQIVIRAFLVVYTFFF